MQGGDVFTVGQVPVFDGEKFAPGSNDALLSGYGGLAMNLTAGKVADATIINDWDAVTPLGGTALQMTPDPVTGIITVAQDGIYEVNFSCNISGLGNNVDYFFELLSTAGATTFGSHVVGSNNVSSQSTGFSLMVDGSAAGAIAIVAHSDADNGYDVVSMSLTVTRIG